MVMSIVCLNVTPPIAMLSVAVCPLACDPSPYVISKDVELPTYVDDKEGLNRLLFPLQTPHCVEKTHKSEDPVS